jgi:hypothetical protein
MNEGRPNESSSVLHGQLANAPNVVFERRSVHPGQVAIQLAVSHSHQSNPSLGIRLGVRFNLAVQFRCYLLAILVMNFQNCHIGSLVVMVCVLLVRAP